MTIKSAKFKTILISLLIEIAFVWNDDHYVHEMNVCIKSCLYRHKIVADILLIIIND